MPTIRRPHAAGLEPGHLSGFYGSLECLKNISDIQRCHVVPLSLVYSPFLPAEVSSELVRFLTLPSPGDLIVAYLAVSTRRSRRGKLTKFLLTLIADSPSVAGGLYQPFQ
jgi:hypothetical protein